MFSDDFHPAVAAWFRGAFAAPTPAQVAAWPAIHAGRHTLVAAPTGSGKTLTAFLAAIDALVRAGLEPGGLADATTVVYVSPLKALSNDIRLNLEAPLAGIRAELRKAGLPDVEIRTAVRTGDTPAAERQRALRKPPHILVTTPESLYVLLGSVSGRRLLATTRSVIVDEIHALAASKRGSHLALTLERLQSICAEPLVRIGLSATQKPIRDVARFLVGAGDRGVSASDRDGDGDRPVAAAPDCAIVDIGYAKTRDLALELPPTPLGAVMSNDQWQQVYGRVAELVWLHRTTLVFVNTRRMAERAARHLAERLGKDAVAAHHGSLAKEIRLEAEQRLKRGALKVLVATASLELGLDVGDVDLVCQLGSPRSIATFLQRAGRSGHAVGGVPKARLFPQSRDELVECAALLDCVRRGELDAVRVLEAPLDVLAQQIVAETACREWDEDALYALVRRAGPYARLARERFDAVVRMLADGYTTRHGTRGSYVHHDAVHHKLRERRGARMTALTSGGTIPETGDYTVVLEPQADKIGSVNEDFAVESIAGDVFQLGNTSYRILRIEPGKVRVEDAHGAAPNIPFWLGEAPGRSDELSAGVARLRAEVEALLGDSCDGAPAPAPAHAGDTDAGGRDDSGDSGGRGPGAARDWLVGAIGLDLEAARQIVDYLARMHAAVGALPTQRRLVVERFFDESGGMQLVIHAPFGSRLNRAWGLALRKRFCRTFNFELQAAATEDAIVLSLSTSHSFALDEVVRYLHSATALDVLVQALLDAPLFGVRWRWNATTALALPRFTGGRKVAPQLQRMKSEDLLAAVFPDQVACAENLVGAREIPEHPLVEQTLADCLDEAMDAPGWLALLRRLERGEVEVVALDLPAPSPFAAEALSARPYAYLDDAPIEERRTQAVQNRRYADPDGADDLGRLDPDAIDSVRDEAWPRPRHADEVHEALVALGVVTDAEVEANDGWAAWLEALAAAGRATRLRPAVEGGAAGAVAIADAVGRGADASRAAAGTGLWVSAERLDAVGVLYSGAALASLTTKPSDAACGAVVEAPSNRDGALRDLLRARLGGLGPMPAGMLAASLQLAPADVDAALAALQREGSVLQGRFTPAATAGGPIEWCERHLLARIHRYTLKRLRREIEPVEPRDFMRFLFDWQHVGDEGLVAGPEALAAVLSQLEGFEAPAALWEAEILPARVRDYQPAWLDELCTSGRVLWTRLRPVAAEARAGSGAAASLRSTPIVLLPRRSAAFWTALAAAPADDAALGARARRVAAVLAARGASFFDDLAAAARLLPVELEEALAELVVRGRVHGDSYAGLRALLVPAAKRAAASRRGRRAGYSGIADAGRWSLIRTAPIAEEQAVNAEPPMGDERSGDAAPPMIGERSGDAELPIDGAPSIDDAGGVPRRTSRSEAAADPLEPIVRLLLRRYGVVAWRLLEREAAWLPPWRDLVRVCRRLEARGEIRGGRFLAGLSGEQYALPEAVASMREVRRRPIDGRRVCLAAADPANLLGSVVQGPKVARVAGARVLYRDGVPIATRVGGSVEALVPLDPPALQAATRTLALDPALRALDRAAERRKAAAATA